MNLMILRRKMEMLHVLAESKRVEEGVNDTAPGSKNEDNDQGKCRVLKGTQDFLR